MLSAMWQPDNVHLPLRKHSKVTPVCSITSLLYSASSTPCLPHPQPAPHHPCFTPSLLHPLPAPPPGCSTLYLPHPCLPHPLFAPPPVCSTCRIRRQLPEVLTMRPREKIQRTTWGMFRRSKRSAVWKTSSWGTPYFLMASWNLQHSSSSSCCCCLGQVKKRTIVPLYGFTHTSGLLDQSHTLFRLSFQWIKAPGSLRLII